MRRMDPPFWYVSTSNIPSQSSGACTGNSTLRVLWRLSTSIATLRSRPKLVQRFHSGANASHAAISMNVANASFSQMPFHQPMVTRSPNHMWASSWATTSATSSCSIWVLVAGSTSSSTSRNVMSPRFSMAPAAKSGRATMSTLSLG